MAIVDANRLEDGSELAADLCVVGAGAAGITLAREFEQQGLRVCLLESGNFALEQRVQSLYDLDNVGYPIRPNFMSRARYFGGSCNVWAGRNMRMCPIDFEQRDWVPNSGWPLDYAELEPWYQKAERVLGVPAFERFARPEDIADSEALERDAFADPAVSPAVALWGIRPMRFGRTSRGPLRRSRQIDVYLNANVTEIVPSASGASIDRLEVRTLAGKRFVARARVYVLACGGLENARLMLVSRQRHEGGIGNRHDVVGRYYLDHPRAIFGRIRVNEGISLPYLSGVPLADGKVQLGIALSDEAQRQHRVLNSYLSLEPELSEMAEKQYGRSINVMKVLLRRGHAGQRLDLGSVNLTEVRDIVYLLTPREIMPHFLYRPYALLKRKVRRRRKAGNLTVINFCEQVPDPDSRVSLGTARDELGLNKLVLDWRVRGDERRSIEVLHSIVGRLVQEAGIGNMDVGADRDLRELSYTDASHHMGTTRMCEDERRGVVDGNCRVHGVANLYIAGSSVFPTAGYANPTLTIVALSLRLAAHLKATVLARAGAG
jgi:choline dehydrogenase-like flavoprotein